MPRDNSAYKPILGESFYATLGVVLFKLGSFTIRRSDLPRLNVTSMRAVRNLQKTCIALDIRSVADLYKTNALELADEDRELRCGVQTLYVAFVVLRAAGYDASRWYRRAIDHVVTWDSLKARQHRDHDAAKREKQHAKARAHAARNVTHRNNVREFVSKAG
jgi:hypothetical protein